MAATTWNLAAPPGFQGLHPDLPVTTYVRHLPHWRQDGATYFVTFRLADSLPQAKLRELAALKEAWQKQIRDTQRGTERRLNSGTERRSVLQGEDDFARRVMRQVEAWLDQGMGQRWLQRASLRKIVADAMHYFDDVRYELGCYVIMPNHVHALIRPLQPSAHPLENILQGRKATSSREANRALGRKGSFWQDESFDRIVRDEEHLWRCVQYIGRNPKTANLADGQWTRWIRPSWQTCGWSFVDP